MTIILGLLIVLGMVFGGYILAGGKMSIIIKALPFELMMIGGASIGAFVAGNKGVVAKGALKGFGKAFKGPKWKKGDYKDLLCLMFLLTKLIKTKGMIAVEPHIENPDSSSIFGQFARIQHDHHVTDLICDTLRMMTMGLDNPHQIEDAMEKQLEKHHHEEGAMSDALQTMADGLPAIGIVAAVLGVIKTMASINEPPEILGKMIGGALVGTFLGVFLSYCIVGPIAAKLKQVQGEEAQFFYIIRDILVAHLNGNAPQVSVEIGRGSVPSHLQPSFKEIEEATSQLKVE
jgi:chemotaxis protein MotA